MTMSTEPPAKKFSPTENKNRCMCMSIENLFSAPLIAAATANGIMAQEQINFLMNSCFSKSPDGQYQPIMITMTLTRGVVMEADNNQGHVIHEVTTQFNIPLLTLMPISSLAVDTVSVEFEIEIVSQVNGQEQNQSSAEYNRELTSPPPRLVGNIGDNSKKIDSGKSTRSYSMRRKASLNVIIQAKQLPLSKGIATVLDMYTNAIHPNRQNPA